MRMASSSCGTVTAPVATSWKGSSLVLYTICITCVSCTEMRVDCASASDTATRTRTSPAHQQARIRFSKDHYLKMLPCFHNFVHPYSKDSLIVKTLP